MPHDFTWTAADKPQIAQRGGSIRGDTYDDGESEAVIGGSCSGDVEYATFADLEHST